MAKKIVLIACSSQKLSYKAKAKDLYTSTLFRKSMLYAKSIKPNKIFILSAKYGILNLDDKVEPYDQTLNKMSSEAVKSWAQSVLNQLNDVTNLTNDEFMFLAGTNYRKFIISNINNYIIPMEGLSIGKQLKWLTENTNDS